MANYIVIDTASEDCCRTDDRDVAIAFLVRRLREGRRRTDLFLFDVMKVIGLAEPYNAELPDDLRI
jgi:hypothetical protein